MASALRSKGITERKSLTLKVPSGIPDNLLRHFWRGMVDGDGGVYSRDRGYSTGDFPHVQLTGTIDIVNSFSEFFGGGLIARKDRDRNCYVVSSEGQNAKKILGLLYGDCDFDNCCLKRKLEVANMFIK